MGRLKTWYSLDNIGESFHTLIEHKPEKGVRMPAGNPNLISEPGRQLKV